MIVSTGQGAATHSRPAPGEGNNVFQLGELTEHAARGPQRRRAPIRPGPDVSVGAHEGPGAEREQQPTRTPAGRKEERRRTGKRPDQKPIESWRHTAAGGASRRTLRTRLRPVDVTTGRSARERHRAGVPKHRVAPTPFGVKGRLVPLRVGESIPEAHIRLAFASPCTHDGHVRELREVPDGWVSPYTNWTQAGTGSSPSRRAVSSEPSPPRRTGDAWGQQAVGAACWGRGARTAGSTRSEWDMEATFEGPAEIAACTCSPTVRSPAAPRPGARRGADASHGSSRRWGGRSGRRSRRGRRCRRGRVPRPARSARTPRRPRRARRSFGGTCARA